MINKIQLILDVIITVILILEFINVAFLGATLSYFSQCVILSGFILWALSWIIRDFREL